MTLKYVKEFEAAADQNSKCKGKTEHDVICNSKKTDSIHAVVCCRCSIVYQPPPPVLTWHRPIYFSYPAVVSGTLP